MDKNLLSCQTNIKFPEPTYSKPLVTKEDRDDWFKRCIADRPKRGISKYPSTYKTPNELMDIIIYERAWYFKWFDQFNDSSHTKVKDEVKE